MLKIEPINKADKSWIISLLEKHWGSTKIVSRGKIFYAEELPGFIATNDHFMAGLITYSLNESECEIITLNSVMEGMGVGSLLVDKVKNEAFTKNCKRLFIITTNDNQKAIEFHQNRGFKIKDIHKNAVEVSRKLKPEIPLIGLNGIPIKDEIELEMIL